MWQKVKQINELSLGTNSKWCFVEHIRLVKYDIFSGSHSCNGHEMSKWINWTKLKMGQTLTAGINRLTG